MATPDQIKPVAKGDPILAEQFNVLGQLLRKELTGEGVVSDSTGTRIRPQLLNEPIWCFLVEAHRDGERLVGRIAYRLFGTLHTYGVFHAAEIVAMPQPNKRVEDYAPFFLGRQTQPNPNRPPGTILDPTSMSQPVLFVGDHFLFPTGGGGGGQFCYVVGINGSDLDIVLVDDDGTVADDAETLTVPPAPGYDVDYFEFDVASLGNIQASDRVALLINGKVLPDRRMKPVSPAAAAEFCEPCGAGGGESAAASTLRSRSVERAKAEESCGACGGGSP